MKIVRVEGEAARFFGEAFGNARLAATGDTHHDEHRAHWLMVTPETDSREMPALRAGPKGSFRFNLADEEFISSVFV